MDVSRLTKLFEDGDSGVRKFTKTVSVGVDRSHQHNWSLGAAICLNSKLQHYFEGFDGVLLGYEDVTVKNSPSEPDADIDLHHITIQAKFYIFSPETGKCLSGRVVSKKKSSITVAVHDYFQVVCPSQKNVKKLDIGSLLSVKISSLVYVNGRPNMMGEVARVETAATLTVPSTSASATVNGFSGPTKRKSEAQEEPKKKARTESQNGGGTTTEESDNEDNSPSKTPKIHKTPGKSDRKLPAGFTFVEHKTEKNSWKDYFGPDGKKYRSIAEIYKKLNLDPESGPGDSSQESMSAEDVKEQVEEVVTTWNKGEDGNMAKNKNKFYKSIGLKNLSKTDRHFSDAKSKKGKACKDDSKETETEKASSSSTLDVRNGTKANMTISDTSDIKKKKKKKNKHTDKTM